MISTARCSLGVFPCFLCRVSEPYLQGTDTVQQMAKGLVWLIYERNIFHSSGKNVEQEDGRPQLTPQAAESKGDACI